MCGIKFLENMIHSVNDVMGTRCKWIAHLTVDQEVAGSNPVVLAGDNQGNQAAERLPGKLTSPPVLAPTGLCSVSFIKNIGWEEYQWVRRPAMSGRPLV